MNTNRIIQLIKAICWRVKQESGYVNKTKLIKYLYLIDIEYYRNHGKIFTEFPWIFYKFGPWAKEYDDIYDELRKSPYFKIKLGDSEDYDTEWISTSEEIDFDFIFDDIDDVLISRRITKRWATEKVGEMLNYVYFYTEPMIDAKRYESLDFSKVKSEKGLVYKRTNSGVSKEEVKAVREKFEQFKMEKNNRKKIISLPKPRYDDVYWEAVKIMEDDKEY